MKPVRQVLRVPGNPSGQRTILVILVHGGEIAPFRIAAQDFRDPRFEINSEHQPDQQKPAGARRRVGISPARAPSGGRKKQADEARFEQHAVGLVAGKILRGGDEGKKRNQADRPACPRGQMFSTSSTDAIIPTMQTASRARSLADHQNTVGAYQKRHAPRTRATCDEIFLRGKDSVRADESANLKCERIECGEKYQSERAQKQPARGQIAGRPVSGPNRRSGIALKSKSIGVASFQSSADIHHAVFIRVPDGKRFVATDENSGENTGAF